jgi:hypothetical protein
VDTAEELIIGFAPHLGDTMAIAVGVVAQIALLAA